MEAEAAERHNDNAAQRILRAGIGLLALVLTVAPAMAGAPTALSGPRHAESSVGQLRVPAAKVQTPGDDPWSSPEIVAPRMDDEEVLKRPERPAARGGVAAAGRAADSWLRTGASLAGVVALILLLAWGYRLATGAGRRLASGARAGAPGAIDVLTRTSLGPRQALYLVRVGPQLVLIGATHESLRALTVVQDPDWAARLAGQQARQRPDSQAAEFERCLLAAAQPYAVPAAPPAPAAAGELKRTLAQAAQRLRSGPP